MTTIMHTGGLVSVVDPDTSGDAPTLRLVGARCDACGTHAFPIQRGCPRCGADTSDVALPSEGTIWSWTVQRIRPKPPFQGPDEFEPFAVGYVDLGPVRVETRLAGKSADAWTIGEPVHLVIGAADQDGNHWTFWFEGGNA